MGDGRFYTRTLGLAQDLSGLCRDGGDGLI